MSRQKQTRTYLRAFLVAAIALALAHTSLAQPVPGQTDDSVTGGAPDASSDQGAPGASAPSNESALTPGQSLEAADGKVDFAHANPEDITNKNFPNLIESFDYPNADIAEVVKAISKLTGKNFILEKGVSGKISIIAPSRITVAEAYKAFLTALAMNNYTVVPSGRFLKIRSLQEAEKESIDTYAGKYFPNTDQLITRIIKLKYINADDVQKTLRQIVNQNGDITPYPPTNSLIVTDLGSNVQRIQDIINQLDVPGFEEKLVVMAIKHARAKDIADLIGKIINKDQGGGNQFTPGFPRFRPYGAQPGATSGTGAASYSLVLPDLRTNSIIVVGNDAGIGRIRSLVAQLDYPVNADAGSGVYVYYVRFGEADNIAKVLSGIASEASKERQKTTTTPPAFGVTGTPTESTEPVFGADVKVTADKETNSLVITASRQDWQVIRTILEKIDIPRDQVFVKAIIMEMDAKNMNNWGVNYYKFLPGTGGIGRWSLVTSSSPMNLLNPTSDQGLNLGWGAGDQVTLNIPGLASSTGTTGSTTGLSGIQVPSLLALINLIKSTTNSNILSAPTLTAIDNEKSTIEVGESVPVSNSVSTASNGTTTNAPERHDVTLKMEITPYISPDTDTVRLKIHNKIEQIADTTIAASNLASNAIAYTKRDVDTQVIVNSGDTAVIGGLMQDKDTTSITKVPILGDIPILGWLFKANHKEKEKMDLLIFITPKIIRNSADNRELVDQKLDERLEFIQKNENGRDPYGEEMDRLPRSASNDTGHYEKRSGRAAPDIGTDGVDAVPDSGAQPDGASAAPIEAAPSAPSNQQAQPQQNGRGSSLEGLPSDNSNNNETTEPGEVEEGD